MAATTAGTAVAGGDERPSTLRIYRDDGPLARALGRTLGRAVPLPAAALAAAGALPVLAVLAVTGGGASTALAGAALAWLVVVAGLSAGRPETGRLGWAPPPVIRGTEYVALMWIGAIAGGASVAAAFALLCALAFRHYDLVYRLRHRAATPPAWVDAVSLGWEGRLIAAWVLLAAGALPGAFFVVAVVFALVFVGDSVAGWVRFAGEQRAGAAAGSYEDEEDEGQ
jgi:hypothetical protein